MRRFARSNHPLALGVVDGPLVDLDVPVRMRSARAEAILQVAKMIREDVWEFMRGRDMYALRKTHISFARRLVNHDAVKLQVGHAPRDTEERHYLDLVDPRESAQAV